MVKNKSTIAHLTARIIEAYVARNLISPADVLSLTESVFQTLTALASGAEATDSPLDGTRPAVSVKKSVSPDALICLQCGKPHRSLKRHLRAAHDLSPEQYRQKFGLTADYPMVAPNYSERRSALAKDMGLGKKAAGPRKPKRVK
jgi:predicted transcriptional regulator